MKTECHSLQKELARNLRKADMGEWIYTIQTVFYNGLTLFAIINALFTFGHLNQAL